MKNRKAMMAIALAAVLGVGAFSGCGNAVSKGTGSASSTASSSTESNAGSSVSSAGSKPADSSSSEQPGDSGMTPPDGSRPEKPDDSGMTPPDGSRPEKPDDSGMTPPDGSGPEKPGGSGKDITYSAVMTFDEDTREAGQDYASTETDENAILVTDGTVYLDDALITRTSSDSTGGDNASFYGVGAAALVTGGTLNIGDSDISTDAAGGAGVFAYGDGTAYVRNTSIHTQQDTSGGIHAAGGGKLYAINSTAETNGASSAAIRSDRGGGEMYVLGGDYTSNGTGSPAIYCTADISVKDAVLKATNSEAVCIEGLNTLRLFDCDLAGNMPDDEQNDSTWTVILYQSMSGDSEVGNSTFAMVGGTLASQNGGLFCTTNTESSILLDEVEIVYSKDDDYLLMCTGNTNQRGWGKAGANGANCRFTARNQSLEGKVIYDSVSTLDFYLTGSSVLKGSFADDETWAGDGGDGYCNVYIGEDALWTVTEDSAVTNLYNAGLIRDSSGKTVGIVGADGKVYVEGESDLTITVSGDYSTKDKTSAADATPNEDEYFEDVK